MSLVVESVGVGEVYPEPYQGDYYLSLVVESVGVGEFYTEPGQGDYYLSLVVESVGVGEVYPEPDLDLVLLHAGEEHGGGKPVLHRHLTIRQSMKYVEQK